MSAWNKDSPSHTTLLRVRLWMAWQWCYCVLERRPGAELEFAFAWYSYLVMTCFSDFSSPGQQLPSGRWGEHRCALSQTIPPQRKEQRTHSPEYTKPLGEFICRKHFAPWVKTSYHVNKNNSFHLLRTYYIPGNRSRMCVNLILTVNPTG